MTETIPLVPHLSDGELVRLLDGECDPAERERAEAHTASCEPCAARLARLRQRTTRLAQMLERADFPVPHAPAPADAGEEAPGVIPLRRRPGPAASPAGRPWLRVAAVILVALGIGVAASPARAWIAQWIAERLAADRAGSGDPAPSAPPAQAVPTAPPAAVAQVQFTPAGSEFTLEVAHRQAAGAVLLERSAGPNATAEVVGGTGGADLLVLPAGLRIQNAPGSAAEYRVSVPAGIERVRLRVGGGRTRVVETAGLSAEGERIELAGGK